MSNQKLNVAILTNVIPSYRKGFYDRLFALDDINVSIFCQNDIPQSNIKTIHHLYPKQTHIVPFISILGEQFIWQQLPWKDIYNKYDVVFVDGNPRILSHALIATFLRVCQKKVVIWSMVHSFRNNKLTESVRLFWLRLFRFHFLYNDTDVKTLQNIGFKNKTLIAMNNGLDQKLIDNIIANWDAHTLKEWKDKTKVANQTILLSSGRLTANKYDLMLEALPLLITAFPNILWCIVGDGKDRVRMEQMVVDSNLTKHIKFIGALFEEEKLAPWFLSAHLFVHPCAVGLSIMHAFGYGLPFITHNNLAEHGPEYIAFEEGLTGYSYEDGNAKQLANTIQRLLKDETTRLNMKDYCQTVVRDKYNVDVMTNRFLKMVENAFIN